MRVYDISVPLNDDKEGLGPEELRNHKVDFDDRFSLDHYNRSSINPNSAECDGRHKQVTMKYNSVNIDHIDNAGRVFIKRMDGGVDELCYINNLGTFVRITDNGAVAYKASYNTCLMYKRTGSTTSPGIAVFNTMVFDETVEYSNSTGIFTALRRGTYMIVVTPSGAVNINLYRNGSSITQVSAGASSQNMFTVALEINDTIAIYSSDGIPVDSILNIGRWS